MAGIGFKLQQLFQEDYFSLRIKAYVFAGLVTSGPWLIIILTIALMQWMTMSLSIATLEERTTFNLIVSYSFIFSQVVLGVQQLVVTRHLADCFYAKRYDEVFPAYIGMIKTTVALALVLFGLFLSFSNLPAVLNMVAFVLFMTVNLIWVHFIFLSAAKFYQAVAYSFLAGGVVSVAAVIVTDQLFMSYLTAPYMKSVALTASMTLGLIVTLCGLFASMLLTFPRRGTSGQFSYYRYFDKYPSLFWTSLTYNIGVWVGTWLIWFAEGGRVHLDTFRYHPVYDTAIFLSYLTIIPTMTIFVISVETRFYERYRMFYSHINEGGTYQQILRSKAAMLLVLRQELQRLFRNQGIVSLLFILLAAPLFLFLGLPIEIREVFQLTTIGAFANAMVLVLTLILLYFEDRRGAAYTATMFITMNALWTGVLLPLGLDAYGVGFAIGCTITFAFALLRLIYYVSEIDFHTFSQGELDVRTHVFERVGDWLNQKSG